MIPTCRGIIAQNHSVRMFAKFCVVGMSSFLVDAGISTVLYNYLGWWWVAARTISFTCAVTNGFFWNQRWTFRARGHRQQHQQYAMFVAVNIVGLLLNITIMKLVFWGLTREWTESRPPMPIFLTGLVVATVIVTFWNFTANKRWTFRRQSTLDAS